MVGRGRVAECLGVSGLRVVSRAGMAGREALGMLGVPDGVRVLLFGLDGVLTRTATMHAVAWKETFDAFLRRWAERTGAPFVPFDPVEDCGRYVDGKPRAAAGTRSFLEARGIDLRGGDVVGSARGSHRARSEQQKERAGAAPAG